MYVYMSSKFFCVDCRSNFVLSVVQDSLSSEVPACEECILRIQTFYCIPGIRLGGILLYRSTRSTASQVFKRISGSEISFIDIVYHLLICRPWQAFDPKVPPPSVTGRKNMWGGSSRVKALFPRQWDLTWVVSTVEEVSR